MHHTVMNSSSMKKLTKCCLGCFYSIRVVIILHFKDNIVEMSKIFHKKDKKYYLMYLINLLMIVLF